MDNQRTVVLPFLSMDYQVSTAIEGLPVRALPDRQEDKKYLKKLSEALDVSEGRIKLDENGDWNIFGMRGKISTDSEYWYLYTSRTPRKWNNIKRDLSWMEVHQDGDDEGVLRCSRMPFRDEAVVIRKIIGMRPRTKLTEEGRALLKNRFKSPSQRGVLNSRSDLNEVPATMVAQRG